MNAVRHLKNALALLTSGGVTKVLQFVTTIVVIKRLSVGDNGVFQLAYSLGFIIALLGEVGVRGYVLRELARRRDDEQSARKLFGDVLNLRLALTAVVTPAAFLVLWAAGYSQHVLLATLYMVVYSGLDALSMLFKFVLRAYERMEFDALFSIIGRAAVLVLVLVLPGASESLTLKQAMIAHAAGALIECAGLCFVLRLALPLRFFNAVRLDGLREALVRSLPFAVVNVTGILYLRTGTLALSKLAGEESVAYFNTAGRLPEAALFLPVALVNAVVPFLSRHATDRVVMAKYFDFLLRYILLAGCAVGAFFIFEPRAVILAVSKPEYLVAAPAFQLYGAWMAAAFVQYATTNLLICLNDERWVMRRYGLALAVNILLNLALVPYYGVTGAAWAMLLSQAASTALDIKRLRQHGVTMRLAPLVQAMVLTMAMAAVLAGEATGFRMGAALGAATAMIAAMGWHEDRDLLLKIIRRRTSAPPAPAAPPDAP